MELYAEELEPLNQKGSECQKVAHGQVAGEGHPVGCFHGRVFANVTLRESQAFSGEASSSTARPSQVTSRGIQTFCLTGTGPTGAKSSPPTLHFGNLQTNVNYFSGAMDQLRIYNSVLSASDVMMLANEGNTFTITASAGPNGSVGPSGVVTVNYGTGQTFTLTPSAGYGIANLLVDSVSIVPVISYTFSNVTANHTISATFDRLHGMNNQSVLIDGKVIGRTVKIWGKVKSVNGTTSFTISDGHTGNVTVNVNGVGLPTGFGADKYVAVTGVPGANKVVQAQTIVVE